MTLGDFNLTGMKDGLMAPARVKELISMMKKENLSEVKNIGESARQWSTVASTLAATENKDSLDQFIRLDGLYLLNQWLREAQNYSSVTSDGSVEESISALLRALMQLPIGKERSDTSGIKTTINSLLRHKSGKIQEMARTLFDSWNHGGDNDADQDITKEGCDEKVVKTTNVTLAVNNESQGHCPVEGSAGEDNQAAMPVGELVQHSRSSESSLSETLKDVQISASSNRDKSHTTLSSKDEYGDQGDPQASSVMSPSCQKTESTNKESSLDPGVKSTITCHSPDPMASNVEDMSADVPELLDFKKDAKETDTISNPEKISENKMVSVSLTVLPESHSSSSDPTSALQSVTDSIVLSQDGAKESPGKTILTGVDEYSSTSSLNSKNLSSKVEIKTLAQVGGCYSNALQDLSSNFCISRKPKDAGEVNHRQELAGQSILQGRRGDDFSITRDVSNSIVNAKLSDMGDKSRLDMDLEFMVDDALEVATQVAKEVEREVVDYREPFCSSSSEENSEGRILQPSSPDSINGEQHQSDMGALNETPTGQNLPGESEGEDHPTSSRNTDEPSGSIHDQDLSQVTAVAQEPEGNAEKCMCDFDLNEEVSSDELDNRKTPNSPPVKFVSASEAPTSVLAAEPPLHFEEEQGSLRSAATSTPYPASFCRTLDSEKTLLVGECSDSLKQRRDIRDIDLNVTEGDDSGAGLVVEKQIPVSSGLPSGESSIEVSSRRADRIKLDLNLVGDNENVPTSNWGTEGRFPYHHLDIRRSPSPASSSSSRQPSMRNIDLNDNPYLCDSYDKRVDLGKSSSQEMNASGTSELDDPVISIMGTKVVVNRKDPLPRTWSFLPNGHVACSGVAMNFTSAGGAVAEQPATAYAPYSSSMFGNGGITMGSSVPPSLTMYGTPASIPYVVDSRGAPVTPEMMGSMMAVSSSYYSQPFHMSMSSSPFPPNVVDPRRPILDLNSGLTVAEGESRELGGLRQLFVRGQNAQMEEHTRANLHPLSLELGVKRSEPDAGFDAYPINFKQQQQPPWR